MTGAHWGKRPLRVAVIASSVGYYVRPPERNGPSRPYPDVLEELLRSSGVHAEVVNHSAWFLMVHQAFKNIQGMVVPDGADVAVLNFGVLEAESTLLPTALVKSVYNWSPTTHGVWSRLRYLTLRPVHRFHEGLAPSIMKRFPSFHRLSPRRFEEELARTVDWLRKERNALVLVLNINPVGDNVERKLPGTRGSVAVYNAIIERVVQSQDDGLTRLIDVNSLVARGNGDDRLVADGIHFTAEGHRQVASLVQREIQAWLGRDTTAEASASP